MLFKLNVKSMKVNLRMDMEKTRVVRNSFAENNPQNQSLWMKPSIYENY